MSEQQEGSQSLVIDCLSSALQCNQRCVWASAFVNVLPDNLSRPTDGGISQRDVQFRSKRRVAAPSLPRQADWCRPRLQTFPYLLCCYLCMWGPEPISEISSRYLSSVDLWKTCALNKFFCPFWVFCLIVLIILTWQACLIVSYIKVSRCLQPQQTLTNVFFLFAQKFLRR